MKKMISILLMFCVFFAPLSSALAVDPTLPDSTIQTINNNVEVRLYAYKKTKHYTAVEIGFTNNTNHYVTFSPKEIYLDDEVKYSQSLLSMDQIRIIEQEKPGMAIFPTAIAVGLGIAALGTSRSHNDVAFGLAMGALGAGGAALLTKGLEDRAKQNKFIAFENNTITNINKLPPGMTLGGVLYFSPTKKPKGVTMMVKNNAGQLEKKIFLFKDLKKKRK